MYKLIESYIFNIFLIYLGERREEDANRFWFCWGLVCLMFDFVFYFEGFRIFGLISVKKRGSFQKRDILKSWTELEFFKPKPIDSFSRKNRAGQFSQQSDDERYRFF